MFFHILHSEIKLEWIMLRRLLKTICSQRVLSKVNFDKCAILFEGLVLYYLNTFLYAISFFQKTEFPLTHALRLGHVLHI